MRRNWKRLIASQIRGKGQLKRGENMQDRMLNVTRVTQSPTSETILGPFDTTCSIYRAALEEKLQEMKDTVERWQKKTQRR